MTRCGLLCGMAALAALSAAVLGPAWLHTEERLPYLPRHLANIVSVRFKLGLFKACPKIVKPANLTTRKSIEMLCQFFSQNIHVVQPSGEVEEKRFES
ncbi:hypothetical protein TSAR_005646 [Trichomalopsis sarcophagae]|uniref:Uncharacterized protein n=1 Tax=Trichomalopsis sarcophagae TaxID=543379 RepID=A0A232FF75_9HYME|nr:hypothetical protein TSAR_005646 [Trichomalopsis sarcophagae]